VTKSHYKETHKETIMFTTKSLRMKQINAVKVLKKEDVKFSFNLAFFLFMNDTLAYFEAESC
jgi:hypothetical protein